MRTTVLVLGFLLSFVNSSALADIVLESYNDSFSVIYRIHDRVYFEKCTSGPVKRGCSGATQLSQIYSAPYESYIKRIESFYGLNDALYAGSAGTPRLASKIERLKDKINHADLSADELKQAHQLLKDLVVMRNKKDQAQREIGSYLENGSNTDFSEQFQAKKTAIVQYGFYKVGFFEQEKLLVRTSTRPVAWPDVANACSDMGRGWTMFKQMQLLPVLSQTPLVDSEALSIWTGSRAKGVGQYRIDCNIYNRVRMKSIEEYKILVRAGITMHETPGQVACGNEGAPVETYLSPVTEVVTLSAGNTLFATDARPIESEPGVPSAHRYTVLCEKMFEPQNQNVSDGAPSFSLYELDHGLELVSREVYQYWAEFFQSVAKSVAQTPLSEADDLKIAYRNALTRVFVLNLLDPALSDIQSAAVKEGVIPVYLAAKEEWNHKLGINSLADIEMTPGVYRAGMQMVHAALVASRSFIQTQFQSELDAFNIEVGKAMGLGSSSLLPTLESFKTHEALISEITANPRTHGFGVLIQDVRQYLINHKSTEQ